MKDGAPTVRGDYDGEHILYRKRAQYDFEAQFIENDGEDGFHDLGSDHHKTEALRMHYEPEFERSKSIYCTCGETFRKDKTAIEHIKEVGAAEDHQYDPERWREDNE